MTGTLHIHVASRDLNLASVRYRALLPGCAAKAEGWKVRVCDRDVPPRAGTTLALAVKPLSQKHASWARHAQDAGVPVVADLCDNIFIDGYAGEGRTFGQRFVELARGLSAVTVPTGAMREVVLAETGLPDARVLVVPDIVETPDLLARQRRLLGLRHGLLSALRSLRRRPEAVPAPSGPVLLWYGNHGAGYAKFGLEDLLLYREALREAASRGAELWVVSNNRGKFERLAGELPVASRYFEWTPTIVDALLPLADVCLVPNSLDAFSATKSANRGLKALSHGVPVVATPSRAYRELAGAVWLDDPGAGIAAYLDDPSVRERHLQEAARIIAADYSFERLRQAIAEVAAAATGARA